MNEVFDQMPLENGVDPAHDAVCVERSTNAQLRDMVTASGLQPAVAMTIFNRGLVPSSSCSESQWKSYLAEPGTDRFLALPESHLAHAIQQFAQIGVQP